MQRRNFLKLGLATTVGALAAKSLTISPAFAAEKAKPAGKGLADKDILKDGQPTTIANYCENPKKQPNKACPMWKEGHCDTCQFFNKDNSLTEHKGGKYARCQLLTDPSKPQFVAAQGWCATYVKKA